MALLNADVVYVQLVSVNTASPSLVAPSKISTVLLASAVPVIVQVLSLVKALALDPISDVNPLSVPIVVLIVAGVTVVSTVALITLE